DGHCFSVWTCSANNTSEVDWVRVCFPKIRSGSHPPRPRRSKLDHHRHRSAEPLIDQVLFVLKILAKFVEDLASFSFRRITSEYEVDKNTVYDRFVFNQAALNLLQQLVLLLVLIFGTENPLHPSVDQPVERFLELRRRF